MNFICHPVILPVDASLTQMVEAWGEVCCRNIEKLIKAEDQLGAIHYLNICSLRPGVIKTTKLGDLTGSWFIERGTVGVATFTYFPVRNTTTREIVIAFEWESHSERLLLWSLLVDPSKLMAPWMITTKEELAEGGKPKKGKTKKKKSKEQVEQTAL